MPKLTSIDGYKKTLAEDEPSIDLEAVNVWCVECGGGLFAWKMDVNNESNNLLTCATCQANYPLFDVDGLIKLMKGESTDA
tara:strand:- start:291 stop:533 length:243 start_codon:yes stop_codon:yes gene_type:complete